jgi:hypothetical protein
VTSAPWRLLALLVGVAVAGGARGADPAPSAGDAPPASPPFHFEDVARQAGLDRATWCGSPVKAHILESGGSGLALVDYDGDGDLDLYLVDGWRLEGAEGAFRVAERGRSRLYRNAGDGTFEDVTERAGVGFDGWGTGVAAGDYDGDGWIDLLVTSFGPDVLYRNRGDGSFATVPGAPSIDGWSTGAAFFDADSDGDLDLFLAAYIDCTLEQVLGARRDLQWQGIPVMRGPFGLEGLANRYFENLGGGRFREATAAAGLTDVGLFYSFGVAALDLEGDRDLDLYVANDSNPNYLYQNDGAGHFREVGLWSGAALDRGGAAQAGMGVAAGDVDGDGRPELVVTNFERDATTLYHNLGDLLFEDVSAAAGVAGPTYEPLSWGTTLSDLDLDGDLDLFIANGHIYPQADQATERKTSYRQRNLLLAGEGDRFVDVTESSGSGLQVIESSRGVAVGDVDGDGDLDLAVSNVDAPPTLLRNDTPPRGAWLLVDAPGALLAEVAVGGRRWVRQRVIGGSYLSVGDERLHFGLGAAPRIDRLQVVWPGGRRTVFQDLPADRVLVLANENRTW